MRNREDVIHEGFDLNGQARYLSNYVLHYPFRDIRHYLTKIDRYADLMVDRMTQQGRRFRPRRLPRRRAGPHPVLPVCVVHISEIREVLGSDRLGARDALKKQDSGRQNT